MSARAEIMEKRHFPRIAIQGHLRYRRIPITIRGMSNAMVLDVSQGGFRFRSDELLNPKSNLLLELHLAGSYPVHSLATVAWVRTMSGGDGFEMGGRFVEPTFEARKTLEKIVRGN